MNAGADAVYGENRRSPRRVVRIQRLDEQQLRRLELAMFLSRHDRADDTPNQHLKFQI
jgi:hypothetical protein